MAMPILVGTEAGLWSFTGETRRVESLADRPVTALAADDDARVWAIVGGRTLWARDGQRSWQEIATVEGPSATCLASTPAGVLVGTEEAHLLRLHGKRLEPIHAFDRVQGREQWYTPWGDPADVRSISAGADRSLYVNVHVGGVVRSQDGGQSWTPTVDIEADVHQVVAHPAQPGLVLAAAAVGLGVTRDGGETWDFVTRGLHAHYSRAVTVADQQAFVSASSGPRGRRAALYRFPLTGGGALQRCRDGLPSWFEDNIDTACVAAHGRVVAFGTEDGRIYRSLDGREGWELVAEKLGPIRAVLLG